MFIELAQLGLIILLLICGKILSDQDVRTRKVSLKYVFAYFTFLNLFVVTVTKNWNMFFIIASTVYLLLGIALYRELKVDFIFLIVSCVLIAVLTSVEYWLRILVIIMVTVRIIVEFPEYNKKIPMVKFFILLNILYVLSYKLTRLGEYLHGKLG